MRPGGVDPSWLEVGVARGSLGPIAMDKVLGLRGCLGLAGRG